MKSEDKLESTLDDERSAGPATCFLIAFDKDNLEKINNIATRYFHELAPATRTG